MDSALLQHWKTEVQAIAEQAEAEHRDLTLQERTRVADILDRAYKVKQDIEITKMIDGGADRNRAADTGDSGTPRGEGLAAALIDGAKWHYKTRPSVVVPLREALRVKALTVTDTPGTGFAREGPLSAIGQDRRLLWPLLQQAQLGTDLAVSDFTQTGTRSVSGTISRSPTATSDKATLGVTLEHTVEQAVQLAILVEDVPNAILEASDAIRAFINSELRFQIDAALDVHCIGSILAAGPPGGLSGANLISQVRNAVADMRGEGANPTIIAMDPTDAAALDLATTGTDAAFVFPLRDTGSSSPLWGLRVAEVAGIGTDPVLIDPSLLGALYLGTVAVAADPFSSFAANLTSIRMEVTCLMHVRQPTGAYLVGTS